MSIRHLADMAVKGHLSKVLVKEKNVKVDCLEVVSVNGRIIM
jgi:hypothetical protein